MWCGATLEFMRGRLKEIGRVREYVQRCAAQRQMHYSVSLSRSLANYVAHEMVTRTGAQPASYLPRDISHCDSTRDGCR